ncbi:carbohydrate kinase [Pseudoflavonifractor sp. 524-17]|uniref:carbohydrate kinase family protein n=1 Tax=Pseudoflavonifractor sp. 524-17 TaxID=2304577 RepID=UPI00137AF3A3|nr:carbohydrate kinase [Pseudoflavonifractor sp. 524-17]NCE65751.1 carbohydrate kinase [Pseudoflavonifractor sp. 524-17]
MADITAIGEILIDLTQTGVSEAGVPLFAANPGGAPANVAVAAARLGAKTAFIGKTGQDGFGGYLHQVLEDNGVDSSGLRTGREATTMAIVSVDPSGERDFQFVRGADCALSPQEVDGAKLAQTKVLHFGSVSLTQDPARTATLSAARDARQAGALVSYDPNYRAALWPSQEEAVERMRAPLPLTDILKLSEEELPLLTGVSDREEGSRLLAQQGIALVLITLGADGVFCRWQGKTWHQPGIPVKVADTNGAGDTFFGAVLSRLCRRGNRPLEGLTSSELKDILAFANRAAAFTCSRSGAIPAMPALDELFDEKGDPRLP